MKDVPDRGTSAFDSGARQSGSETLTSNSDSESSRGTNPGEPEIALASFGTNITISRRVDHGCKENLAIREVSCLLVPTHGQVISKECL